MYAMENDSPIDSTNYQRLNEVRKQVWSGGMKGLVFGAAVSVIGFYLTVNYLPSVKMK